MPRRPSIRRPMLGGLAAAALLLASCGDDDTAETATDDTAAPVVDETSEPGEETESDAATTGACELLPEAEVVDAFGEPAEVVHEEGSGASLEMCEWRFATDEDGMGLPPTLQLVLMGPDDYESRTRGGEGLYEEVPDLGDDARWAYSGSEQTGFMAQLLVLDGDRAMHLNAAALDLPDEAAARDRFVSLAEGALAGG
ncbi:hypothetical protein NHL50_03945 [Acidimicrobiia bacterium EGI L10123]|uniref:hypothetical protein n=1 Tax=Salinilacustrithrix flava TaxID=2957203 RepID=UPI003D7C15BA|nr:hypothetical protein [Acidimicrobiia bacterium EGI L10123]